MKRGVLLICALVFLFSCSKDSEDQDPGECGSVNLISVTQDANILNFDYQSDVVFNYYEIGYDISTNVSQVNQSSTFNFGLTTTNMSSISIDDENLSFYAEENITLTFYIRAQCSNGALTSWQGPIVLQIEDYCEKPFDLDAQGSGLSWDYSNSQTSASYYEVEYGLQGFSLGSGNLIISNDESTFDAMMTQGNTYDFYVRAFCENGQGFSSWAGPVSSFAEQDYNLCTPPSNVSHEIQFNSSGDPVGVLFKWNLNGENLFEHVLIPDGLNPDDSSPVISTSVNTLDGISWPVYSQGLSQNTPYDFYIRAVCVDGSRTEWVGPRDVTIN